jgi:hypothetical protein
VTDDAEAIVARTRRWIERAVIGLDLCPFAGRPYEAGAVGFVVSAARDADALVHDLETELRRLSASVPAALATTLLIHPHALTDFVEYNDFLDVADALLDALDLTEEIQIASFHPDYRFADAAPGSIDNYTNRSPHPMLHLLRSSSVERAIASFGDTSKIYTANIATLRRLGFAGWRALEID